MGGALWGRYDCRPRHESRHPIDTVLLELQRQDRQRSRLLRAMESKAATASPAMLSAANYFQTQLEQARRAHKLRNHYPNKSRKVPDLAGFSHSRDRRHACAIPERFSSATPRRRPARRCAALLANTPCSAAARRRPGGGAGARPHPHAGLSPATQRGACQRHSLRKGGGAQPGASRCFNAACDAISALDQSTL